MTDTVGGLNDLGEFLVHAITLEDEAAEQYDELADAMDVHNNAEVAALFRRMAGFSRMHAKEGRDKARGFDVPLPHIAPWEFRWPGNRSPEAALQEHTHYMMTPYHALAAALEAERRGHAYYAAVAEHAGETRIRRLAAEMADEESEHVDILLDWLGRYPEPENGWDEDPDPANIPE